MVALVEVQLSCGRNLSVLGVIETGDPRLMALEFEMDHGSKLVTINVYLPYRCDANLDEYVFYFSNIDMLVSVADSPYANICGDFNANVTKHGVNSHRFGHDVVNFVRDADLVIFLLLPDDTYTYLSEAHVSSSWIMLFVPLLFMTLYLICMYHW